jgi:carboxypeptidase T
MKQAVFLFGVCAVLLCVAILGNAKPITYLADFPMKSVADVQRAVQAGQDVVGVDFERGIYVTHVRGLSHLTGATHVRAVQPVPDREYKQPADIERLVKDFAARYPADAKLETFGKSIEGRDLFALAIGHGKKTVLFDAMHHAREVMTPEVALDIAEQLLSRKDEPKVKAWLDALTVYVVPMLNPDGNNIVWTQDSMHRKNARGGYGVDINRNYPTDFAKCGGSSGNRYDETYHGSGPASEPETQAIIGLAARIRPVLAVSYHTFSEIVIYPYGCAPKHVPANDRAAYESLGRKLASLLVRDSGRGSYRAGTSYELLYNVDGGSVDHLYQAFGTWAFVIEVNGSQAGFQPDYSMRDVTVKRQRPGWEFVLDEAVKK